jgi:ribosome-binding protein aMBF1 (putative translation factor)
MGVRIMNCEICGKNEDERNIQEQSGMNICLSCDGRYSDEELQNISNILNIKPIKEIK